MRHTPNSEQVTSAKGCPTGSEGSDVGIVSNFFRIERGGQLQGMLKGAVTAAGWQQGDRRLWDFCSQAIRRAPEPRPAGKPRSSLGPLLAGEGQDTTAACLEEV